MTKAKNKYVPDGYHARRLEPIQENPREVAFAEQWVFENQDTDRLFALLNPEGRQDRDVGMVERRAVATVIQWLGSNVGLSFVRGALNRAGLDIVRK